jgi:pimeloyl-ACP methyl ester carboxylesterase
MSLRLVTKVALLPLILFHLTATAQTTPLWRPKVRPPFPLTGFYDSPKPWVSGKPGDLIRSERFDDYDVPSVVVTRILYHSQSASGADVPVSGVVLTPVGNPPAGGWPVIAWAHTFSGVARACAPSLARNLDYGPAFSLWTGLHYAVVATDYAGLGADGRNAVMDMRSNANDVINAIKAAHAAVPKLGAKWIAIGDSEGAPAVVALNEMLDEDRDPNFMGSLALSGVANAKDLYGRLAKGDQRARLVLLAYATKTMSQEFDPRTILTTEGMSLYDQTSTGCAPPTAAADDLLRSGWESNPPVQQFFGRNLLGEKRAAAPILVISGEADPIFTIDLVVSAVRRLCKQGDRVQFDRYPNLDRLRVPGESITAQTSWVRDRFAGKATPNNCP